MKLDMTSPIEERIRQINQIDSIAVLEALLRQMPASDDADIMKEWETTKALIRGRIAQISEHEKVTVESSHNDFYLFDEESNKKKKMRNIAHILALISFIISAAYLASMALGIISITSGLSSLPNNSAGASYTMGVMIGIWIAIPYIILIVAGFIFSLVSLFVRKPWTYITVAAIYTVALLVMISSYLGLIIQMVLMYTAFGLSVAAKK